MSQSTTSDDPVGAGSASMDATPATHPNMKRGREDIALSELTATDVQEIIDSVSAKRDLVLHHIGTEKLSEGRKKLSDFVTEISNAITKLSSAYLSKLAAKEQYTGRVIPLITLSRV